jgi:hypothetical protein
MCPKTTNPLLQLSSLWTARVFFLTLALAMGASGPLQAYEMHMLSPGDAIEVIQGDPNLLDRLPGKIVVLGAWSNMNKTAKDSRTKVSRAQQQQEEKNDATCKKFARDFRNTAKKFAAEPDVIFIGNAPTNFRYTKAELLEHAAMMGFTDPIVKIDFKKTVSVAQTWWGGQGKVLIYSSDGLPIYGGELDSKADAAIRNALKAKVGQNLFGK